jgi:zinc transport system ATP-binding protein
MKVIEVENLSYAYGSKNLFSDISFAVEKAEFVKLTGPNGSGKSTLVKLLIRELEPLSGKIKLFGQDIKSFKKFGKIGYLPQKSGANVIPATAEEIVLTAFYGSKGLPFYTKEDKKNALLALERVKMADYKNAIITSLSGGQLQRVMTARLLAAEPELLILDEPMTGIDAETVNELYTLFKELTDEGVTVFMISHDISKRDEVFDRSLCLAYGNIIQIDKEQMLKEMHSMHEHPGNN